MKYVLFPHGGSGNHGCEAIVRTTKRMIGGNEVILFSDNPEEDEKYLGEDFINITVPIKNISRLSLGYWRAVVNYHVKHMRDAFDLLNFSPVLSECRENSTLLSIGGDNYCYGENEYIYLVNKYARKNGTKTILWGCSVEPEAISEKMEDDLKGYDLIVARESITYTALSAINQNTILAPDPAFTLGRLPGKMPVHLEDYPYVGINISPLIIANEIEDGIVLENYKNLIERILKCTEYNVALIPHVVWKHNDDRTPLKILYKDFSDTKRVFFVEDQDCMQLKDIIAKCKFFVGARTHATIAAYSTMVPTLVVGYSVKAKGIARDLFGTEERYVIPVQQMKNKNELWKAFQWLQNNEKSIRKHLEEIMPQYIEKALNTEKIL